jgi:chloramphenicol 3-O phosphotransferase
MRDIVCIIHGRIFMLLQWIKKFGLNRIIVSASCCLFALLLTSCFVKKTGTYGTVIILNGSSAVGKSSIMRAFQAKHTEPWLGIGIDNFFIGVLPAKFYLEDKPEHHVVMQGIATEDAQGKLFTLHIGEQGQKIIKGMHRAIAAYAKAGNNVIVDYIMYDSAWHDDLKSALSGVPVIFVGVTASLPTLEQREKMRGTSPEGHARSIYESVHQGWHYDLEINTDEMTPNQIADRIDMYIESNK